MSTCAHQAQPRRAHPVSGPRRARARLAHADGAARRAPDHGGARAPARLGRARGGARGAARRRSGARARGRTHRAPPAPSGPARADGVSARTRCQVGRGGAARAAHAALGWAGALWGQPASLAAARAGLERAPARRARGGEPMAPPSAPRAAPAPRAQARSAPVPRSGGAGRGALPRAPAPRRAAHAPALPDDAAHPAAQRAGAAPLVGAHPRAGARAAGPWAGADRRRARRAGAQTTRALADHGGAGAGRSPRAAAGRLARAAHGRGRARLGRDRTRGRRPAGAAARDVDEPRGRRPHRRALAGAGRARGADARVRPAGLPRPTRHLPRLHHRRAHAALCLERARALAYGGADEVCDRWPMFRQIAARIERPASCCWRR